MAIELHHLHPGHDDEVSRLKARIAELERMDAEHTLHIAKMNGYINHLEEERRWRKCSEELPEDGSDVLATDGEEIWLCYKTTMTDGLPWFQPNGHYDRLVFMLGYPKSDDTERRLEFKNPKIRIGTGKPEWGAELGKMYFVISWGE